MEVASTLWRAPFGSDIQRLVGDREACVEAYCSPHPGVIPVLIDETEVLDEACDCFVVSVAVRNLVAEYGRKPGLLENSGDRREAAADARR